MRQWTMGSEATVAKGGRRIARADVATFMLDELARRDNVGHALAIAY